MLKGNMVKRCLSVLLVVALLVTSANLSWALEKVGIINSDGTITVTDAQIVSSNYEEDCSLTTAEKAVLNDAAIVGNVHKIKIPSSEDNLIKVDSTKKTITADDGRL